MTKNLWGDLGDLETVRTPQSLLREQASLLTELTNGVLIGSIDDRTTQGSSIFRYDFDIVAPSLNHYTFTVLQIQHGIHLYPVQFVADNKPERLEDESALEDAVAARLQSDEVRRVIASLLAQAS